MGIKKANYKGKLLDWVLNFGQLKLNILLFDSSLRNSFSSLSKKVLQFCAIISFFSLEIIFCSSVKKKFFCSNFDFLVSTYSGITAAVTYMAKAKNK